MVRSVSDFWNPKPYADYRYSSASLIIMSLFANSIFFYLKLTVSLQKESF